MDTPCNIQARYHIVDRHDQVSSLTLYNSFPFSLRAMATKSSVLLSSMKHLSALKVRVNFLSAKKPTLNKFFVMPGV